VIVRFVNIGGIDAHHCLNFLFIVMSGLIWLSSFRGEGLFFGKNRYTFANREIW